MKKIILSAFIIATAFGISGCVRPTAEENQRAATNKILNEIDRQIGMPDIHYFQEKKIAKLIMEERDRADLICYVYTKSEYTGKFTYLGKCVGYPLPYSTQFTNPVKAVGPAVISQADPNGLYMPPSADATWIYMINPNTGKPSPQYFEDKVDVFTYELPSNILNK